MKVEEVAKILKIDIQTVRTMIASGVIPGAVVFKKKGSKRSTYYINEKPFRKWCGIEEK